MCYFTGILHVQLPEVKQLFLNEKITALEDFSFYYL